MPLVHFCFCLYLSILQIICVQIAFHVFCLATEVGIWASDIIVGHCPRSFWVRGATRDDAGGDDDKDDNGDDDNNDDDDKSCLAMSSSFLGQGGDKGSGRAHETRSLF